MARICLLTAGQPSTQPRLVKEADALTRQGHDVEVVCGWRAPWAERMDRHLLAKRDWRCHRVGGDPEQSRIPYVTTRLLHGLTRRSGLAQRLVPHGGLRALARVGPALIRRARGIRADLYIAHNLEALPAAVEAARRHGGRVGFDAEDYHSGIQRFEESPSRRHAFVRRLERELIPRCDYVTAAAPLIAERYERELGITRPTVILNVFPLSERPGHLREHDPADPMRLYWYSQTVGPDRGLEEVVRALGHCGRADVELHVRGSCDPAYRAALHRLASASGLAPDRILIHEPAPPDDMIRLASAYDVGLAVEQPVSVNRDICLTNKIFSYLLAGNAVLATATRGQRPFMDRIGGAGFCYEPGAVDVLSRQVRDWCADRGRLAAARHRAWDLGGREYNWEGESEAFLRLVDRVLDGEPASAGSSDTLAAAGRETC